MALNCNQVNNCVNAEFQNIYADTTTTLTNFCKAVATCMDSEFSRYAESLSVQIPHFESSLVTFLKGLTGYSDTDDKVLSVSSDTIQWTTGVGTGSVTSIAVTVPSGFSIAGSPITSSGTIAITGAGSTLQYMRGDGSLATFPTAIVTAAGEGLTILSNTAQLGQTFNQASDPSAFTVNRELFTDAHQFRIRDDDDENDFFLIDHTNNGGVFQFNDANLLETIIYAEGFDKDWVKIRVHNSYDDTDLGNGYTTAASGVHISNSSANGAGGFGQLYLGFPGNSSINDGLMVRSTGAAGLRITADSGPIVFTSGSTGSGEYARFTGGKFIIGGTVPTASIFQVTSSNTTGSTTASSVVLLNNSLTTGTGSYIASSSITSGSLMNIAVTGVAAATGQIGLNISISGVSTTGFQTTYGLRVSNTHGNNGINYAASFDRGSVSIGTAGTESGVLQLYGATSGSVNIIPALTAGDYYFRLPATAGAAGSLLTTQGGSTPMTWTTPAALTGLPYWAVTGTTTITGSTTINGANNSITLVSDNRAMLNLSGANTVSIGDYNSNGSATSVSIDDANETITLNNDDVSILLERSTGTIYIGDVNDTGSAMTKFISGISTNYVLSTANTNVTVTTEAHLVKISGWSTGRNITLPDPTSIYYPGLEIRIWNATDYTGTYNYSYTKADLTTAATIATKTMQLLKVIDGVWVLIS